MQNLSDYIDWRGDLLLSQSAFCEVDNLVLSMICYLNYSDVIPTSPSEGAVLFSDAVKGYLSKPTDQQNLGLVIPCEIPRLAQKAASCRRFAGTKVTAYVNEIDESLQMQFSALTYLLPDGSIFIAYRGTDDTIVGWKEDFFLAISPTVPAQRRAVGYLSQIASVYPGDIRLGGHSKGGNLSVFAAACAGAEIQSRIISASSNDGPGFLPEFFDREGYRAVAHKLITYIPQSSVVGMLLRHTENFKIIHSTQKKILQHDPFSWAVMGSHFIYEKGRSSYGRRMDAAINHWLNGMSYSERVTFTESLFSLISSSGAKTLTELASDRLRSIRYILSSFTSLKKSERDTLLSLLHRLLRSNREQGVLVRAEDKLEKQKKQKAEKDKKKTSAEKPKKLSADKESKKSAQKSLPQQPAAEKEGKAPEAKKAKKNAGAAENTNSKPTAAEKTKHESAPANNKEEKPAVAEKAKKNIMSLFKKDKAADAGEPKEKKPTSKKRQ